jgi:hypothetical protein
MPGYRIAELSARPVPRKTTESFRLKAVRFFNTVNQLGVIMKTLMMYVTLLFIGTTVLGPDFSSAQTAADEEAIKKVVLAETDFFFARDYKGWESTFAQASGAVQIWNNSDGSYTHAIGWQTISENVRAFMEEHPEPDTTPLFRENFTFQHFGHVALVTFDKYMGDREKVKPIKEIRVVERQDGKWKIVCVAAFSNYLDTEAGS